MDVPKRYHTHKKKEILRFADLDLKNYGMDKEFSEFMEYIDDIDQSDPDALTLGRWKKLYAVLRILSDKANMNYCIYENKHSIFFDVTSNCLGSKDEISEEADDEAQRQDVKESSLDKLKRYKYEVSQIDLKIAHLQKRREEYEVRIAPLKAEIEAVLEGLI
jgi:hypothetical protein